MTLDFAGDPEMFVCTMILVVPSLTAPKHIPQELACEYHESFIVNHSSTSLQLITFCEKKDQVQYYKQYHIITTANTVFITMITF
jgi:hypothetical protein